MIDIQSRLQKLMNECGLNIYTLARRSDLTWNTVKNLFDRSTNPTIGTLSAICDGLGISLAQFFNDSPNTDCLTAEQQHLINRWTCLSDKERQTLSDMINLLLEQHK